MSSQQLRALKRGTVWSFTSKGIKFTRCQSQKFQKSTFLLSKFGKPKVWLFVFLMPLEIKLHTVPHFKALNSGKDLSSQLFCGGTFDIQQTLLKSTYFTSYRANRSSIYWSQCTFNRSKGRLKSHNLWLLSEFKDESKYWSSIAKCL